MARRQYGIRDGDGTVSEARDHDTAVWLMADGETLMVRDVVDGQPGPWREADTEEADRG